MLGVPPRLPSRAPRLFLFVLFGLVSSGQVVEWTRQFGTTGTDWGYAAATALDAVYVAGSVNNGTFTGSSNAGGVDAFVTKLDLDGKVLWSRQFGTSAEDVAQAVAANTSGVYVVGYTRGALTGTNSGGSDIFVRKYDPDGNVLWTRQFGGSEGADDKGFGAALDNSSLYVTGYINGVLPNQTGGGGNDAFVRRYDPNGNEVWTRQFGTLDLEYGYGVATDSSGIYVSGETGGSLGTPVGGLDYFVRKYDSNGTAIWTRQFGTNTTDGGAYGGGIAVNNTGVYIAGGTTGTFPGQTKGPGLWNAFIQKFDLNGNPAWVRQYGEEAFGYGVAVGPQWVYVAGQTNSSAILWRLDVNGNPLGTVVRGTFNSYGLGIATDGAGAYLTGGIGSNIGEPAFGDEDAFVIKVPHPPLLTGISDAFNGQPGSAPSTWTSLYGTNLAKGVVLWNSAISGTQLPTTVDGVSVNINGKPATIYFTSAGQVNVLAPLDDQNGNVQVTLTNRFGTSQALTITKSDVLPAFYAPFGEGTRLYVTAVALDGSLLGKPGIDPRVGRGVKPGEIVQFYATGFGKTNPLAPSDKIFTGAPEVITAPKITIGGKDASLLGKGNLVGPGLYQFNLTIPDVADGDQAIVAEIGTVKSPANVFLTVKR